MENASDPRATLGEHRGPYVPRAEEVAHSLREAIYDGHYSPGQPIRQEAVAHALGVSRLPVREALRQLAAEGLVVIRPRSGARVARLDFEEFEEIYKIRERLEPLALAENAGRFTDAQLDEIAGRAQALEELRDDPRAWLEADRQFHLACYTGVNPRLLRMIIEFANTTQHYRRLLLSVFGHEDFEVQHSEHRLIVDALATGNARAGETLVRGHIERTRLRLAANRSLFSA